MDRITGLMNAPAPKRYRSFVTTAADTEEVWQRPGEPLCVWQDEALAAACCPGAGAELTEVHDFCAWLAENEERIIRVCPNGRDHTDVTAAKLLDDLQAELELLE